MDAVGEQITRAMAIKEVMRSHGLDRNTSVALIDELIRIEKERFGANQKPIGIHKEPYGKTEHIRTQGNPV